MFDPNRNSIAEKKQKQELYKKIELMCKKLIENDTLREGCSISIQEVLCGDPNCAPVDTVIAFTFQKYVSMIEVLLFVR